MCTQSARARVTLRKYAVSPEPPSLFWTRKNTDLEEVLDTKPKILGQRRAQFAHLCFQNRKKEWFLFA